VLLLAGLGNPGNQYAETRHNIGFRFLDQLSKDAGLHFSDAPRFRAKTATGSYRNHSVILVKPQTFMNHSGEAIAPVARYYRIPMQKIIVIYDDLDLPVGKIRFKRGGGHGGHNGLRSLHQHLENIDYARIKIGIGRPDNGQITPWVLGKATSDAQIMEQRIFNALLAQMALIMENHFDKAANHVHSALQCNEPTT